MIRILHVPGGMNAGGIETLLMSIYRKLDKTLVQFDFLCNDSKDKYFYEDEIMSLGGNIHRLTLSGRNPVKSRRDLGSFYKSHPEYQIVHFHMGSMGYLVPLRIAKMVGIPTRILHAHCAYTKAADFKGLRRQLNHMVNRKVSLNIATDYFACSQDAADWFGFTGKAEKCWSLLKNGIDTERFAFSMEKRASARKELGIDEDEFLVMSVGRMTHQKNHLFLVRTFARLVRKRPKSRLIIVGNGTLHEDILSECEALGIADMTIILQNRSDIDELLSASDAFAFPSIYEGLGIALVEAQANGLCCFASDRVPKEAFILKETKRLPIEESEIVWANELAKVTIGSRVASAQEIVREAGYDISTSAEWLLEFYQRKLSGGIHMI